MVTGRKPVKVLRLENFSRLPLMNKMCSLEKLWIYMKSKAANEVTLDDKCIVVLQGSHIGLQDNENYLHWKEHLVPWEK